MTKITRGRKANAIGTVIYGTPGVGKSTLAAGAPSPIFIGPEENAEMDVARFPIVKSYGQLIGYLKELEQGKHKNENFKTVVLDSISGMEKIIHDEIASRESGKTIATVMKGYGRGHEEAARQLWGIREALEQIRAKMNYNIIVIGHSVKTLFNDPVLQTEYDVYEMSLHKSKRRDCNSFFTEWASMVLFLNWVTHKTSDDKYVVGQGKREILTEYRPSHTAKNRFGLPYSINIDQGKGWELIQSHLNDFYASGKKEKVARPEFDALLAEVATAITEVTDKSIVPKINDYYKKTMEDADQNLEEGFKKLKNLRNRIKEIIANQ